MNDSEEVIEVDVSTELGYYPAKISDQISGKWFPDSKVKPGTRWFYVILLIIVLCGIVSSTVDTVLLFLK